MKIEKEIQQIFNNTTVNQKRVKVIVEIIEREQKGFAEMILKNVLDVDELSKGRMARIDYDLKLYKESKK